MTVQRLILIRHGEAEHLVGNITGGWTDTRLTPLGIRQARRTGKALAELLPGGSFQILSSDLLRARQTAELIGQVLGVPPLVTANLREISNGAAANRTRDEARALFQPFSQPRMDWQPYPGAETWRVFLARLLPFLEGLRDTPATAVLVTHANVLSAAVQWWLQMTAEQMDRTQFYFDPCSITDLRLTSRGLKMVHSLNNTAHLAKIKNSTP